MSRAWNLEGLAAARVLVGANAPLSHVACALERTSREIDTAMWALLGRTPDQALAILNGCSAAGPGTMPKGLPDAVLQILAHGAGEIPQLSAQLGVTEAMVGECLAALAQDGVVDFLDPPPPAGPRAARWFLVRRAQA